MNEPKAPRWSSKWFYDCIERGKHEIFTERVMLGPALARELLSNNPSNRNLRPVKVAQFVSDMQAGAWQDNGETIIIAQDSHLNDGQHRCEAVIKADVEVPILLVFGVTRDSRHTVDQGSARTASDILAFDGVQNATAIGAALRLLCAYDKTGGESMGASNRVTTAEILAKLEYETEISENVRMVSSHRLPSLNPSMSAFMLTVFKRVHREDAEEFITSLLTGENIKNGNPAYMVRQRLIRETMRRNDVIEMTFRAFINMREGKPMARTIITGKLPKLS